MNLGAEADVGERASFAADQLPVKPGRAVARNLPVEVVSREHAHIRFAAVSGIVSLGAGLEIVRDPPTVGIDPLDNAGAAERLQATDMAFDVGVIVPTWDRTPPASAIAL